MKKILVVSVLLYMAVGTISVQTGTASVGRRAWSVGSDELAAEVKKLDADSPWRDAPLFCYVVPAISPIRRLPDALPPDGTLEHLIRMVGAMGEFIPASFIVAPLKDIAKLEIKASTLRPVGGGGRSAIPAENVDIKVVKVWWQPGTAWHGYHQDKSRRELVPELLLNDETLIKVDFENEEHYLRLDYPDGPQYLWNSYEYPQGTPFDSRATHPTLPVGAYFDFRREPVEDSPVLLPVKLHRGRLQQFWVTVKAPENAEGLYEGGIELVADDAVVGKLDLRLRVLPFTLPDPRTYYDLDRDFIVSIGGMGSLRGEIEGFDGDQGLAEKRLRALYKNQRDHGLLHYAGGGMGWGSYTYYDQLERHLELVKEAGFRPPLIQVMSAALTTFKPKDEYPDTYEEFKKNVGEVLDIAERVMGTREVYLWGWGEPGRARLETQLDGWRAAHEMGAMIGSEGKPWHFPIAGYAEDMIHLGGQNYPHEGRKIVPPWHALGQRVTAYACPHPGAENPDMSRRVHGMLLYKNWFDGTRNNQWFTRKNWMNFLVRHAYRIRLVYPTRMSVIDTIHWEGFREGIDDIRYATKLKMLAAEAIDSGDVDATYAAKKALLWLELHDEANADLNAMRLEMINYIMKLKGLMEG